MKFIKTMLVVIIMTLLSVSTAFAGTGFFGGDGFVTEGKKYDEVTAHITKIAPEKSGLDENMEYHFRLYDDLLGNYFYHVNAINNADHTLITDFLVAKDYSAVWRRFDENRTEVIDGSSESMLASRVKVSIPSTKIPLGVKARVSVSVPAGLPYELMLVPADTAVVNIEGDNIIVPRIEGKTNVRVMVTVGNATKEGNFRLDIKPADYVRRGSSSVPIGIGVGIGRGGWRRGGWGLGGIFY